MEHIVELDSLQFPVFSYKRHPNCAITPTNLFALAFGLYMISAPMMSWIDYNSPSLASALCFAGVCEYLIGFYNWYDGRALQSFMDFVFGLLFLTIYYTSELGKYSIPVPYEYHTYMQESLKIVENEKLYTEYARERKKESGETIEISLFGKWIGEITLKEALYILEPNNYNSLQEFKNNFKKCNTKKIKEIISEETNELYLKPLGINIEELEDDSNKMYKNNSTNISRTEQKITYSRGVSSSHPPEFYYEIDKKFVKYVLENYKD